MIKEVLDLLLHSFDTYEIRYKGEIYTNNDAQSLHWRKKGPIVSGFKTLFKSMTKDLPYFEEFALVVYYNSRHDADNISSFAKIFIDSMKKRHFKDDSKKYYKMFAVLPDESLNKNEFVFKMIKIK